LFQIAAIQRGHHIRKPTRVLLPVEYSERLTWFYESTLKFLREAITGRLLIQLDAIDTGNTDVRLTPLDDTRHGGTKKVLSIQR